MKKEMDCMICGVKTSSMGTGLCDNCWEFERRIPHTRKETKRKLDKVFQYRLAKGESVE